MMTTSTRPRVLIVTTFPAPYRVDLFAMLDDQMELSVIYERHSDPFHDRNPNWYTDPRSPESRFLPSGSMVLAIAREMPRVAEYDLVIFYEYATAFSAALMISCLAHRVPYAINCDGAFVSGSRVKSAIKRFFISRADACLAGSDSAVNYFRSYGAGDGDIWRHAFTNLSASEVSRFARTASRAKRSNVPPRVLFVGQFIPRKGLDTLLEAWKRVGANASLRLVGSGELEDAIAIAIEESRLDNVEIVGSVSREDLADIYAAADMLVLPTREDVWGLVVTEAMAAGLPVITTTRCNAGLEMVGTDGGSLVAPGDADALAAAIAELVGSPGRREEMGHRNAEVVSALTLEMVCREHTSMVQEITSRRRRHRCGGRRGEANIAKNARRLGES